MSIAFEKLTLVPAAGSTGYVLRFEGPFGAEPAAVLAEELIPPSRDDSAVHSRLDALGLDREAKRSLLVTGEWVRSP